MNSEKIDWMLVQRIAYAVRDWSERHARIAKSFHFHKSDDLGGMCAYSSTILLACLHRAGVSAAVLVSNQIHAHVRVRSRIVDVTATQFRRKGDEIRRVEVAFLKDLRLRYPTYDDAWDAQEVQRTPEDAFDALNPDAENGFCEGQYWKTRSAMRRTIQQALHFCEKRGLFDLRNERLANRKAA